MTETEKCQQCAALQEKLAYGQHQLRTLNQETVELRKDCINLKEKLDQAQAELVLLKIRERINSDLEPEVTRLRSQLEEANKEVIRTHVQAKADVAFDRAECIHLRGQIGELEVANQRLLRSINETE